MSVENFTYNNVFLFVFMLLQGRAFGGDCVVSALLVVPLGCRRYRPLLVMLETADDECYRLNGCIRTDEEARLVGKLFQVLAVGGAVMSKCLAVHGFDFFRDS